MQDQKCHSRSQTYELPQYHDVQSPECLDRLIDQGLDFGLLAHICLDCEAFDIWIMFLDEYNSLLSCGYIDVREDNVRALTGKEERRFETDTAEYYGKSVRRILRGSRTDSKGDTYPPAPVMIVTWDQTQFLSCKSTDSHQPCSEDVQAWWRVM